MPGPEQSTETPKPSEAEVRKRLDGIQKEGIALINDELTEHLVKLSQSDDQTKKFVYEHTMKMIDFARGYIKRFAKAPAKEKSRILPLLTTEEKEACQATTLLLSKENFGQVADGTVDAHAKFNEIEQLVYDKERKSGGSETAKKLLASPEEMAQTVLNMSTKDAEHHLFTYRYNVNQLATYTDVGVFTMNDAIQLASAAKTNPQGLEKVLAGKKSDYERMEHASADSNLDRDLRVA